MVTTIEEIRAQLAGKTVGPLDDAYDALRTPFHIDIDQHPAVIVAPECADDIVAAVQLASLRGLAVSVQATGHGIAKANDGGLLINTSRLRAISVDADARTVTVEPGVAWSEVVAKTAPYRLMPLTGSSTHVGAVGYSLGGGTGWLVRQYGLATDSIVAASVVTADGVLHAASEANEPDLFWGLKGSAGNLGVVTSLTLRLFPVEAFFGGILVFPLAQAREVFVAYRDWARALPPHATTSVSLTHIPAMPTVPPPLQGQSVVIVRVGIIGSAAVGEALVAPLRSAVGEPAFDSLGALPLEALDAIGMEPTDPLPVKGHAEMVRSLSDEALDALLAVAGPGVSVPFLQLELRHLGGGVRPAADRQGLGHWSGEFQLHAISVLASPEAYVAISQFNAGLAAAMKPYVSGLVPLNFLEAEPERTVAGFTEEHYRRLVALKKRYDPSNLFRLNNNIPPVG